MIYILIENYIPFGYANRISREKLVADTRLSDRKIRKELEEALLQRDTLIINIDNGYFRPDGSLADRQKVKAYLFREQTRPVAVASVVKLYGGAWHRKQIIPVRCR